MAPGLAIRVWVPGQLAGPGKVSKGFADAVQAFGVALSGDFARFMQKYPEVGQSLQDRGIRRVTIYMMRHMGKGKRDERFADVQLGSEAPLVKPKKKLKVA
jgi:hypothetical protein